MTKTVPTQYKFTYKIICYYITYPRHTSTRNCLIYNINFVNVVLVNYWSLFKYKCIYQQNQSIRIAVSNTKSYMLMWRKVCSMTWPLAAPRVGPRQKGKTVYPKSPLETFDHNWCSLWHKPAPLLSLLLCAGSWSSQACKVVSCTW